MDNASTPKNMEMLSTKDKNIVRRFIGEIVWGISCFAGKETRSRRNHTCPVLTKRWEEMLGKSSPIKDVHYECVNLFMMIIKDHKEITLLDVSKINTWTTYRFDEKECISNIPHK